jgi:hypothetical protein
MPHRFPFAFVDGTATAGDPPRLRVRLTAAQEAARGGAGPSPLLLIEVVAQAALRLLAGDAPPAGPVALAGLEELELAEDLARHPLQAGDELWVSARPAARLGRLLKLEGQVERDGETIARGTWLLAVG